jgi:tetraacyldisaccharide 4'-kinase
MMKAERSIRRHADRPVFFTRIRYGFPQPFGSAQNITNKIILVSGIADATLLVEYAQENFKLIKHMAYGDHYAYRDKDLNELVNLVKSNPDVSILTTEKDMVKIASPEFQVTIAQLPLFYLPIEIEFIKNGKDFDEMVLTSIQHGANN